MNKRHGQDHVYVSAKIPMYVRMVLQEEVAMTNTEVSRSNANKKY